MGGWVVAVTCSYLSLLGILRTVQVGLHAEGCVYSIHPLSSLFPPILSFPTPPSLFLDFLFFLSSSAASTAQITHYLQL